MNALLPSHSCFLISMAALAALAPQERGARVRAGELERVTIEGFVLAPDGSPAEGAVVVSSAGGKAVTDASGGYRLVVEVAHATSVQLTAVGSAGGKLVASASFAPRGAGSSAPVDPLVLGLGASCSPSWVPEFGGKPGTNNYVNALAVFDDGSGPALYAGGAFTFAGAVAANRIVKWDGASWAPLGSGVSDDVHALAVYDDGSGPALYAGGAFTSAGGAPGNRIAKWDGTSWTALGSGMNGAVRALTVHDDGSGPALYAGGDFTSAGGAPANRIAKWDGATWSALGSGTNDGVYCLAAHDDGGGTALYAGGDFTSAGGAPANRIAKWDGVSWTPLGSGVEFGSVLALAEHDDGGGAALYAAGNFMLAGARTRTASRSGTARAGRPSAPA